jgi:hypothetical protein
MSQEGDNSLRDAVAATPGLKHYGIVNRIDNFRLLSTEMGTAALYDEENDTEDQEGFYKLQKLKRISTASLQPLIKRQGQPDTENLLCLLVEDEFVNNLDVLDEVSEPDSTFSSVSEAGGSNIAESCRTLPCFNESDIPVQSPD